MQLDTPITDKLVFIETFGCQMNENDSERILGFLRPLGYTRTADSVQADLIIINTCTIRDKAEHKVYSMLGTYKDVKAERPGVKIAVCGCVAQQDGRRLLKRAPYVDLVFGTHNIHRLKGLLTEISVRKRVLATDFSPAISDDEYSGFNEAAGIKTFVSIMRGCNNFCTYCIVPYTRGREVSRRSSDVIAEVERHVGAGVKEVTLLGQNVNSYGAGTGADVSFHELLRGVSDVEGLRRLRFFSSNPRDISNELIRLYEECPKLCRHIHLPVQSGSNGVLAAMRRGYTVEEYMSKVDLLKELYPDISVTTDIIVGFPGETDDDFDATIKLVELMQFDASFSFTYSKRPGTAAAGFAGQIPLEVGKARLVRLQSLQKEITAQRSSKMLGRAAEILVEGPSRIDAGELTGRTKCNRVVNFAAPAGSEAQSLAGALIDITITDVCTNTLRGIVAADEGRSAIIGRDIAVGALV